MSEPIAEFHDYESMRIAFSKCRERRNISLAIMDEIAGAPDRYFSKLLGPSKIRCFTPAALGWAFGALGCRAVLVDDHEALARVIHRYEQRDASHLKSARGRWDASRPLLLPHHERGVLHEAAR
jgi:hypothetical protein